MKKKAAKKAIVSKKPLPQKRAGKKNEVSETVVEPVEETIEVETAVETEQVAMQGKTTKATGRNSDKFAFNGNVYGKGPLVREVVRQYVAEHPKITIKQLKEVFPDELLKRFGIFQEESFAKNLSGARDRYFFKEEHLIKLGDKKVVAVCNQFTSENIIPFLAAAKKAGFKIK